MFGVWASRNSSLWCFQPPATYLGVVGIEVAAFSLALAMLYASPDWKVAFLALDRILASPITQAFWLGNDGWMAVSHYTNKTFSQMIYIRIQFKCANVNTATGSSDLYFYGFGHFQVLPESPVIPVYRETPKTPNPRSSYLTGTTRSFSRTGDRTWGRRGKGAEGQNKCVQTEAEERTTTTSSDGLLPWWRIQQCARAERLSGSVHMK